MRIKELIKNDAGFLFIIDSLDIQSAAGRRHMLNTEFSNDPTVLETEWSRLAEAIRATNDIDNRRYYIDLRHCLMCLHDLSGTFTSLANRTPLNEVELFEIKNLCYMSKAAATAIQGLSLTSTSKLREATPCASPTCWLNKAKSRTRFVCDSPNNYTPTSTPS